PVTYPATPAGFWNQGTPIELGLKFRADVAGYVTGVRFYKGPADTGTHTGSLWTSGGQLLATATFGAESATGWQQVSFDAPVAVSANTTYVVSYFSPTGNLSFTNQAFAAAGVDNPPLRALQDGTDGPNGVFRLGPAGGFPDETYAASNYWVDVIFVPGAPPAA
ncbi:MAG TPA: DUF4082 domain-containing protein, partial [Chloroflexota bacterium]|nr:DUF4082 domain-containing protein [Chloroflexota bacterium]